MNIETILAIISAFAAVIAAFVAIYQAYLSRITTGADILMRLEDRFENVEFCEKRKKAAYAILSITRANQGDIEDIFDFFETVGLLVDEGVLDEKLAWSSFFYWLHGYCYFAKDFLESQRKKFPSRYEKMVLLHERLTEIENSKKPVDESEWSEFLNEEKGTIFSPAVIIKRNADKSGI